MPLRRILVLLLLLVFAMTVAASLTHQSTDTPEPARPSAPPQGAQARTIAATLPRDRVVRAAVGDEIVLAVKANVADQVQIDGYDLIQPVDPLTPARFDFVGDHEGSFAVTLVSSGEVLGRLEVVARP